MNSSSNGWASVLKEIDGRHPCLARVRVAAGEMKHASNRQAEELPTLLRIVIGAAVQNLEASNHKPSRLAMILPRWGDGALWTATGVALCSIAREFEQVESNLPDFVVGQKLMLDKTRVVQYEGEDERGLRLRVSDGVLGVPRSYRLRLQPTETNRRLSPVPWAGRAQPDLLDDLLGIECQGARHIFRTRVALVTGVGKAVEAARHTFIGSQPVVLPEESNISEDNGARPSELLQLFQWGSLSSEGMMEIRSGGQLDAPPSLLLCPDLLSLRQFLREKQGAKSAANSSTPLVVLDGASSFRNRLDILNPILDSDAPVLACIEHGEQEACAPLIERGFEVWRWTPDDLSDLHRVLDVAPEGGIAPSRQLFGSWQKALNNYSRHSLREHVCRHDGIECAADALIELLNSLDSAQPETKVLEGALYGSLLHLARSLQQPESEARQRLHERLARARAELLQCGLWLDAATHRRASDVLDSLESASAARHGEDKIGGLRAVAEASSSTSIAVVVSEPEAVETTRRQWQSVQHDNEILRHKTVSFCCPATAEAHLRESRADHLVICGWLGATRMRRLIDGCLAADITLLLYSFERAWLRGALRRWRGRGENMSAARRLQLLGMSQKSLQVELRESGAEALASLQNEVREKEQADNFDASDFEMRLRVHRRALLASSRRPGEETEAARLIELSGGHFAFLSGNARLPLVNELMASSVGAAPEKSSTRASARKSELPQKRAEELTVGDYVVFRRGAGSNLIRDMADLGLRRAGLGQMRETSRLWKIALRQWVEAEREQARADGKEIKTREIIRRLQKAGIARGELTIRFWLEQDRVIGPSEVVVLETIARITQHEELNRKLPDVGRAISKVRGAHLAASEHLAQALMTRLPAHLARNRQMEAVFEGALEIEIEGVGSAVVVRVEEIGEEMIAVARSQINLLQREAEETDMEISASEADASTAPQNNDAVKTRTIEYSNDTDARTLSADLKIKQMLRDAGF